MNKRWVVASSFTADLIVKPLQYLLERFGHECEFYLHPYGQLLQGLLDFSGELINNQNGVTLLLIRISDFFYAQKEGDIETLEANIDEFLKIISHAAQEASSFFIISFCPEDDSFSVVKEKLLHQLMMIKNISLIDSEVLMKEGFKQAFFDLEAEKIAHIPYSQEGFAIIAKRIVREFFCVYRKPYKVIVVDCDNTLWQGACAELGAKGVNLSSAHLSLQKLLLNQYNKGILICLCSKNIESDVVSVFTQRQDMVLKKDHITVQCINWDNKSDNIRFIANTLDLSLDSFIFIDDNPVECAEVQESLPEVLTILLPSQEKEWLFTLNNIWAFDSKKITEDDKNRNQLYKESFSRNLFSKQYSSLTDFIENLNINIDLYLAKSDDLSRVSQLSFRTNQFNCAGVTWTEAELIHFIKNHHRLYAVRVSDRFGDYGLVGFLAVMLVEKKCVLKNFALSCRVLGKGIEYKLIKSFAEMVSLFNCDTMIFEYKTTERNLPARSFLDSLPVIESTESTIVCKISELIKFEPKVKKLPTQFSDVEKQNVRTDSERKIENQAQLEMTAYCNNVDLLCQKIFSQSRDVQIDQTFSSTEKKVASIFSNLLTVKSIDSSFDFFASGGSSIIAVQILSRIYKDFSVKIALHDFFNDSSIKAVSRLIENAEQRKNEYKNSALKYNTDYPLYFSQRRLWYIEQLMPEKALYNVFHAVQCKGELNLELLNLSFKKLIEKYGVFRTAFFNQEGEAKQFVYDKFNFSIQNINVENTDDDQIKMIILNEVNNPFNLKSAPLLRVFLLSKGGNENILLIISHHIIVDGWSWNIIKQEISNNYNAFGLRADSSLCSFDYVEYAIFQDEQYKKNKLEKQKLFWMDYLKDISILKLPIKNNNAQNIKQESSYLVFKLSSGELSQIKEMSVNKKVTLFSILFSALSLSVYSISKQTDFLLGMASAGRNEGDLEKVIGLFVRTLLIRVQIDRASNFSDFLQYSHQQILKVIENEDLPYEHIIKHYIPRSLGEPIKIMVVFQNTHNQSIKLADVQVRPYKLIRNVALFGILIEIEEIEGGLEGIIYYDTSLYDDEVIKKLENLFHHFIDGILSCQCMSSTFTQ